MRQRLARLFSLLAVCFMLTAYGTTAHAALQAVGPIDPVTTLPAFYQDTANLALQLCLDANGFCILPFLDPITTTGPISDANFPDESFYYFAESVPLSVSGGDTAILRMVLEASFLNPPPTVVVPNTGVTFLRINLKKMAGLPASSTYTVTHPYGSFQFTTDAAGEALAGSGAAFRSEDVGAPGLYFPANLQAATNTLIGPFLTSTGGLIVVPGAGTYIGNPAIATTVTGSPSGNNFFRITGPDIGGTGINTVQTNLFTLSGKVFTGQIPSPMTIDRVTYARDAATGQVDAFVTALPAAFPSISGTGILTTNLAQDFPASGKFFAHLPFTTTLPSSLVIRNSLDIPPIDYPINLVDEVIINQAIYDPVSKNLTIKADSRDNLAPLPVLTAPAFAATLDATGTLVRNLTGTVPPLTVTVNSSKGGSATSLVSIFTPPPPPVAAADTAATTAGTSVVIPVLANDTAAGIINPASVIISTQSLNGFAVANANGTVTFTPNAGFSGPTTFAYTVNDNLLQTSNAATVTVTVTAPPPPVAAADTATTPAGTSVVIPVLANDTPLGAINPATVIISTQSLNGLAVANANGTATFTPAAGFSGTTTFAYTVNDNLLQTSNPAIVTVTVTAPSAPVAVADTATTTAGTAVVIPVLANDTAAGTINTTTLAIATPAINGVAVANINGTVTFTPAAGFSGSTSFTYTFKDNLLQTSNPATVTVTINAAPLPAPLAVADTATTAAGAAVVISVLTNDIAAPGIIDPATVVISTQSLNGIAVANAIGTVTFTPAAGFVGTTTFAYTVKNTLLQVSNAAIVSVTVNGVVPPGTNIAPLAANDVASTLANTPRVINVIGNDTDTDGTINPASVVIVTPPTLGTAVNNLNGTITYTSAAAGTATFTYTVQDSAIPPATSLPATVTVSVTSAITDAVNVLRAEFVNNTRQWNVEGTTTNVSPLSKPVTIYVGNTTVGNLNILGTVNTNTADGRWKFQLPGAAGNVGPAPTNTISVALPSGASRLAFPVAVK